MVLLVEVIVDLNSIRNALGREPFQPFDLCLADGRRVAIQHPEFVAMSSRVVVLHEDSYSTTLEPLLIVPLEPHRGSGKGGNGSHGKKPKR